MSKVQAGRFTGRIEGDFVVFAIGMRFNKLWKVHKWMPVFTAMPKMIATLMKHPEKGMLGARTMIGGRTITMIQYWRSFDHLEAFARNTDDPHLEPWRRFNRTVGKSGDVQAWAGRHGNGQPLLVVSAASANAAQAAARALPHLGRYGWVVFEDGRSSDRGHWPSTPQSITLPGSIPAAD